MQSYMNLSGTTALVTGASSGIGAATAEILADLGARVALGYHRNRAGAEAARDRIAAAGGQAIAIEADVREAAQVGALVGETTAQLGPIDILVNNAGSLVGRAGIKEETAGHLDEVFALNFKSAVLAAQAVGKTMIDRRRGAIVNIVSIAGHTGGGPGAAAYGSLFV
jgi:3-oxoacyl-[acyl-carrier protein] reductase